MIDEFKPIFDLYYMNIGRHLLS